MPENPLAKKMKLKSGLRAAVVDAPKGYLQKLGPLPDGSSLSEKLEVNSTGYRYLPATRPS